MQTGYSAASQVYRVRHKQTSELYAVKRVLRKFRSKADRERCALLLPPRRPLLWASVSNTGRLRAFTPKSSTLSSWLSAVKCLRVKAKLGVCCSKRSRLQRTSVSTTALVPCRCLHEIQAVAALPEHPNIVRYYRAWQQQRTMYLQASQARHHNMRLSCSGPPMQVVRARWTSNCFPYVLSSTLSVIGSHARS